MVGREMDQIEALKSTFSSKFSFSRVYIFGSYAYGKPDQGSDIDICVIGDFKQKKKIDVMRAIRRALMGLISSPMDILVYDEEEFRERALLKNTFEYKIKNDGKLIHG